jgi:hypothetical protein
MSNELPAVTRHIQDATPWRYVPLEEATDLMPDGVLAPFVQIAESVPIDFLEVD